VRPISLRSRRPEYLALAGFLLAVAVVAIVAGVVTAGSANDWYHALAKPSFNPPDRIFRPVWTALYLMMAVAAWRVWCRANRSVARPALIAWWAQLALNLGWSLLLFGAKAVGLARSSGRASGSRASTTPRRG
jgi:translocator protein